MRVSVLFIILSYSVLAVAPCFAATQVKIRYVQSIYDGEKESGLKHPEGVACTDEHFVVADTGNNRLIKYSYKDKAAKAVEPEMPIISPIAVEISPKGETYAISGRDRRIQIFNADGTEKGYLSPKGSPVARKLVPRNFTIDGNGKVYILDIADAVVLVLDAEGNYLRHVSLPGETGSFSDVAVDGQGTIFLVESTRAAVYTAAPDANQFTPLAKGLKEYANFPTSIAVDKGGTIYLVDKHGGSLVLLNKDGSFLGHRFGYGWKESQFYYPTHVCISAGGNFFIADSGNSRIQMFKAEE